MDTATVTIGDSQQQVTFDLLTLERIEERLGKAVNAILLEDMAAFGQQGATDTMRHVKIGFAARFLAAAIDVPMDQLEQRLGGHGLMPAFTALVVPFVSAVSRLNGARESGADQNPPQAAAESAASEPGPASSSECSETSSTA